jgi:hypothetical protein
MCSLRSRIRKIKCNETKPLCRKCADIGRTCDSYESPVRLFTSEPIGSGQTGRTSRHIAFQPVLPTSTEIDPQEVDLLNRYFSTKTMFDVDLGCEEEARQVLQASLTDSATRHAISSLRALQEDLETTADVPASIKQQIASYEYGERQYILALSGLVSNLLFPGASVLKSALLCCQIFISIKQVRSNYGAMAQHIIRGLGIMREHRARPTFAAGDQLVPVLHDQLPSPGCSHHQAVYCTV